MSCQIQSDICGSYTNNGRMFPSPLPTYRFRDIMDVFFLYGKLLVMREMV